jgi:hypothetical protein
MRRLAATFLAVSCINPERVALGGDSNLVEPNLVCKNQSLAALVKSTGRIGEAIESYALVEAHQALLLQELLQIADTRSLSHASLFLPVEG